MKRPIIWALASLCIGILLGMPTAFRESGLYAMIAILAAALSTIAVCFAYRWPPAIVFFVCFVLGFLRTYQSLDTDPLVKQWVDEEANLRLAGYVLESSETRSGRVRIVFDTYFIERGEERHNVRMRIMAMLPEGQFAGIGDSLVLRGRLVHFDEARNPGGFNEYMYYRTRKIHYKSFPEIERISEGNAAPIRTSLFRWRGRLSEIYRTVLPPEESGVIISVVLGDRSGLEDTIRELYRAAGVFHLLSVSGLHISIVSLLAYKLLGLFLDKRRAGVINLALLILYCLFTGSGTGTIRAVLMAGIVIVGAMLFRERDLISSISFAGICMLIYEPLSLFDIRFQLSFSAVFGIAVLTAPIERALSRLVLIPRFLRVASAGNLAASLGTFPFLLYHFYVITPYGFFANLIILPTSFILVGLGVLTGALGLISIEAAEFVAGSLYLLLRFYRSVCEFFAYLPASELLVGSSGLLFTLLLVVALLLFAYWFNGRNEDMKARRRLFFISVGACAAVAVLHYRPPEFEITMLDVGQGDAFVVRENGSVFIIDGGGLPHDGDNTGIRVLIPYLEYLGVGRIDGVFVSHVDFDHAGGILEILPYKTIERLYFPYTVERDDPMYLAIVEACVINQISVSYLSKGDILKTDRMVINTLHPTKNCVETVNDSSLTLQFIYENTAVLFTADIGSDIERRLDFASPTVVKLAHHGSRFSNDEEFLRRAAPPFAIVSTGRRNVFGHPAPEVVERLEYLGIPLYNTARNGAVTLTFRNNGFSVNTMIE